VQLETVREMGCLSGTITSLNRYGIVPSNNTRDGLSQLTSCPGLINTPDNTYWSQNIVDCTLNALDGPKLEQDFTELCIGKTICNFSMSSYVLP